MKIVRDEAIVKRWIEEQSFITQYVCLNMPEPLRLNSREEVEKHFRATHLPIIIKSVESHTLSGTACRSLREPGLVRLVRQKLEDQRRFPLQIATVLSQQFAGHGLQFFKVNKTITHVAVARPHYLDLDATPVSEGIRRIVEFISAHSKCSRRRLVEALVPTTPAEKSELPASAAPTAEYRAKAAAREPSPEETAVIADLHWLIHQGHVIEFADGVLDTARKPSLKPARPMVSPAPGTGGLQGSGEPAVETATAPVEAMPAGDSETIAAHPIVSANEPLSPVSETKPAESADNARTASSAEAQRESEASAVACVAERTETVQP
ncbi:MAG: hypothetical protein DME26_19060 [Verrucomicrobia bacterium]|nr:MAG: hypothetical protein DME26_19060 [Verrucomicrobiota bacterium]